MKKVIILLWSTTILAFLGFFVAIFFVTSDVMLWKMFTVMVIFVMATFFAAAILTAVYYAFPKKDSGKTEEK